MGFKLFLSDRSIKLLDRCIEEMKEWNFDAINVPVLLEELTEENKTQLYLYLLEEGLESDGELSAYTSIYLENRKKEVEGTTKKDNEIQLQESEEATSKKSQEEEVLKPKSEHDSDITVQDERGEKHQYPIANEVLKIFENMSETCKEKQIEIIEPVHIMSAMFAVGDSTLKMLFRDLELNYKSAKKYFTSNEIYKVNIIPHNLSGFITCLNDKVDITKPCEILMRDKEVEQIWNISLKKNKRNTVIVGEAGVGKSALIEKITYDIVSGKCPERFKEFIVISLDVNSLIAGTTFRGQAEERIKDLIKFLEEKDNVILFIDEVHTILGAGSCFEGEMDLSNALKPILARGDTIVIGATTDSEYELYFARDAALSRRFERVTVGEPSAAEVYPMIQSKVRALSQFHQVKMSKAMVEYTIMIANCFAFEKRNPDKTLDLIDRSMVAANRQGKKQVDKECIMENFDIFFDLYEGMGEDARKEVAYHEAGHYIVGKASERLVEINMLAVSIMPAEDYLGVTCHEYRRDRMPFRNKEYYIDMLAFQLGGRVAEKVFRKDFTSGAGMDLNQATRMAFEVITKFGMSSKEEDRNNIFLNTPDYPMFSEKSTNLVNEEVQKLIQLAYQRAESIIDEYKDLLEILVQKLLKKKIMSETELDKVWQQYLKRKNKS